MTYALTTAGLSVDTFEEIKARILAEFRAEFGVNFNTRDSAFAGRITSIVSDFYQQHENLVAELYASMDPNQATGVLLDQRCAYTGTQRKGATQSTVDGVLTFNAAGTVSDGDQFQNDDTGTTWEAYNGPYTVASAGTLAASLRAVETGPKTATAGTTWSLVTANPDLDSFTNPTDDAEIGRDLESDAELRKRRAVELYAAGQGPLAAIGGKVSRVQGVTDVRVWHNPQTSPVDADGIPFKAFNVVVDTDPNPPTTALIALIADAIWQGTGAGGYSYGTDYTTTVTDSEGIAQPVSFDLVDELQIYVNITISTANTEEPVSANMAETVKAYVLETALASFAVIGKDQYPGAFEAMVWRLHALGEIAGVTGVTAQLSTTGTGGPYLDPLAVGLRERPAFDSAAILVTVA